MGAAAIATLAAIQLVPAVRSYPGLTDATAFVVGLAVMFWSVASWWLPLLVIVMIWRHAIGGGVSLTYRLEYWSMVFPLGMYTVATFGFAQLIGIEALSAIPRTFFWIAAGAWCVVFCGMMRELLRNLRLSVVGAGSGNPE
jgi:tellurite resistance protein TehA-like permease